MKDLIKIILIIAVICIAMAFLVPVIIKWNTPDNNKYDILHRQNDSLVSLNIEKDKRFSALELKSDSVKNSSGKEDAYINNIEKQKDEKFKVIDGFNGNQLFEFFTGLKTPDYHSE